MAPAGPASSLDLSCFMLNEARAGQVGQQDRAKGPPFRSLAHPEAFLKGHLFQERLPEEGGKGRGTHFLRAICQAPG